ncbi:MAG: hypothetical protein WCO06_03345, partial [Candidatus Roizmanbacteria bacterium]
GVKFSLSGGTVARVHIPIIILYHRRTKLFIPPYSTKEGKVEGINSVYGYAMKFISVILERIKNKLIQL